LRVIILVSFFVIFTAIITHTSLWIFFYVALAVLANISLLLKVHAPTASIVLLGKKSLITLCVAMPVTIILFFVFPRITTPLWTVNLPAAGHTAFMEDMTPGSILALRPDDTTVMRITFNNTGEDKSRIYWNGLALSNFDGKTWQRSKRKYFIYLPLKLLSTKEEADYEVLLEAHKMRWLFYKQQPVSGWPKLKYSSNSGLIRLDEKTINQHSIFCRAAADSGIDGGRPGGRPVGVDRRHPAGAGYCLGHPDHPADPGRRL
jgi:hypothetical protein